MNQAYYTYCIRVGNYKRVQVEKRGLRDEVIGTPGGDFRYKGVLKKKIDVLNQKAQEGDLEGSRVKEFGEALFNALFDAVLCQDFVNLYNQAVHKEGRLLRIELDIDEGTMPEVAALPWEFMRVPTKANLGILWLATAPNLVFSRRRAHWYIPNRIQVRRYERLRVALAVAAPSDLSTVAYERVLADLQELAKKPASRIELLPLVKPASRRAIDEVLAQNPHIFHFLGHGRFPSEGDNPMGQIALEDDLGEAEWVDEEVLSELLNRHRPGVVMLQACEGGALSALRAFVGVASRVVQQNIAVVVAMQYEVSNSTASCFACEFYKQLAQGHPVDVAAQNGRRSIALGPLQYEKRDFAAPVIFMRVQDGHLFQRSTESTDPASSSPWSGGMFEVLSGPVPLDSPFYVERGFDTQLARQLDRLGSFTTIRGAPKTGKTSLFLRGLAYAEKKDALVISVNFQAEISMSELDGIDSFLKSLAHQIAGKDKVSARARIDHSVVDLIWASQDNPKTKMTQFVKQILTQADGLVVLAMDEVDIILETPFYSDFFGLLRAWHNRRAYDDVWKRLNGIMTISTHPSLLINDISQSPFNIGLTIRLADFSEVQFQDLNNRHGEPLCSEDILQAMELFGGHPYLTHQALHALASSAVTWSELLEYSHREDGLFGSHLLYFLDLVEGDPDLEQGMRQILTVQTCSDRRVLQRLRSAGLVKKERRKTICRCGLYKRFFANRLLNHADDKTGVANSHSSRGGIDG